MFPCGVGSVIFSAETGYRRMVLTRQKLIRRMAFMVTFLVCPPWFAAEKE
jgi:hypothetical protein